VCATWFISCADPLSLYRRRFGSNEVMPFSCGGHRWARRQLTRRRRPRAAPVWVRPSRRRFARCCSLDAFAANEIAADERVRCKAAMRQAEAMQRAAAMRQSAADSAGGEAGPGGAGDVKKSSRSTSRFRRPPSCLVMCVGSRPRPGCALWQTVQWPRYWGLREEGRCYQAATPTGRASERSPCGGAEHRRTDAAAQTIRAVFLRAGQSKKQLSFTRERCCE
jgi:hypothetical protein